MPWRSKKFWAVVVLCVFVVWFFLFVAARRTSYRQGIASSKATGLAAMAAPTRWEATLYGVPYAGDIDTSQMAASLMPGKPDADHKIIHNVGLDLVVKNVEQSLEGVRRAAVALGGFVEKASLTHGDGNDYGTITMRVPQANLERALSGFKQQAVRVTNETIESTDVTKQFTDSQAQLRNYRAEEEQYLGIMRRASTVSDTLEVATKLSDVRRRIEQLQGEFNHLTHQVEMSSVTVTLHPETTAAAAALEWHPVVSARNATRSMLGGLAEFADTIVAVIIHLPLTALWVITVGAAIFYVWKLLRWGYRKMRSGEVVKVAQG